jgi:hypothetical protein
MRYNPRVQIKRVMGGRMGEEGIPSVLLVNLTHCE